jgi:hypothetical protein
MLHLLKPCRPECYLPTIFCSLSLSLMSMPGIELRAPFSNQILRIPHSSQTLTHRVRIILDSRWRQTKRQRPLLSCLVVTHTHKDLLTVKSSHGNLFVFPFSVTVCRFRSLSLSFAVFLLIRSKTKKTEQQKIRRLKLISKQTETDEPFFGGRNTFLSKTFRDTNKSRGKVGKRECIASQSVHSKSR